MIADDPSPPGPERTVGPSQAMHQMLAIVLLTALAACGGDGATMEPDRVVRFPSAGVALHVEVADSDRERARGLMGVAELPADEGMAFVWPEPVETTFWMKDTQIPLSIAFVGADGRIVTIAEMSPCHADPCPTFAADGPFVMAVEANRGFYADAGIGVGDRAILEVAA
jgi:uncharacterized membrane protein (UPF0127 family)